MKPAHKSSKVLITTPQQHREIMALIDKHLEHGGSLLAQVYADGLRVRVLTPAQTKELADPLGKALGEPPSNNIWNSALHRGGEVRP